MEVLLITQIFGGIASGMIMVMMALGLALIFGHLRVVNFAHGAFYMFGAYLSIEVARRVGGFWPALVIVPLLAGLLGVLFERILVARLYGRSLQDILLLTFGVSFILVESIRVVYGTIGIAFDIPKELAGAQKLGDFVFPNYLLFTTFAGLVVVGLIYVFLERTDVGLIIRAGTQDRLMVRALGVNFDRYRTIVFGLGIALAGFAGVVAAPRVGVNADMGSSMLIFALVTVVIGGLGSFWGAVASGLLIGVVQSITALIFPQATQLIVFVLMGLVLLIRPKGLLGTVEV